LQDSKTLSSKKRTDLYQQITQNCLWAVGQSSAQEIDQINILQATLLAMKRAIINLNANYDEILIDGNQCVNLPNCKAIIKGDAKIPCISAASIVAKVTRDQQMLNLDKIYPQYGFAQHKGYGTKQHLNALSDFGVLNKHHRLSFKPVKNLAQHLEVAVPTL
jgi:ribonuclease HII